MEPKKEKMEPDLEQGEKQRLDSVTSSESFASSGFQEDKSEPALGGCSSAGQCAALDKVLDLIAWARDCLQGCDASPRRRKGSARPSSSP